MPIAARRRPNGSAEPLGSSPTANAPTSVSMRSASARIAPTSDVGSAPPCPLGHQCSSIAVAICTEWPKLAA